jgi:hypothetical protein
VVPLNDNWEEWNEETGEQQHGDRLPLMRLVRYESTVPLMQEEHEEIAEQQVGAGLTVNISSSGLCLLLDWAPQVRALLRLHVPMSAPTVKTPTLAEVRWVRPLPFRWGGVNIVGLRYIL